MDWWTDQSKKKSKMDWRIGNQYIFLAVGYRKNESLYIVYDVGFEKYEWENEIWVSLICKVSRFT